MLLYEGTHRLKRRGDLWEFDFAAVTADRLTSLQARVNGQLVEHVYVAPGNPHTWWPNNPLLGKVPIEDQVVEILVGEGAILRIEAALELA